MSNSEQVEKDAVEIVELRKAANAAHDLLKFDPSSKNMVAFVSAVKAMTDCEERLLNKALLQQVAAAEHAVDSFEVGSPEWEEARKFLEEQE